VKILTVHEPWAWAFFCFGDASKDVENRSRPIPKNYRGPLAIHVSRKRLKENELAATDDFILRSVGNQSTLYQIPPRDASLRGHVIGIVDVIDCVKNSPSPWAIYGYYHWVTANPRRVKPVSIVGQQGMFERDLELEYL
jgi:hypothetical protein